MSTPCQTVGMLDNSGFCLSWKYPTTGQKVKILLIPNSLRCADYYDHLHLVPLLRTWQVQLGVYTVSVTERRVYIRVL